MTDQEVDEFNEHVDITSLLEYRAAVGRQAPKIVRDLDPDVPDEEIDEGLIRRFRDSGIFGPNAEWVPPRWLGRPQAFTFRHTVLGHTFIQIGQCDYVRSLLGAQTV